MRGVVNVCLPRYQGATFTTTQGDIRRPIKKGLFYTVARVSAVGDDGYLEIDHERDTPPVCGVSDSITPMPFLIE